MNTNNYIYKLERRLQIRQENWSKLRRKTQQYVPSQLIITYVQEDTNLPAKTLYISVVALNWNKNCISKKLGT
jgi:hypothetical protein